MTDVHEPTPEEIATWQSAVEQIRAEHPDWDDAYIAAGLAWAVMTPEVQAIVAEIAAQHELDVAKWTAVIVDLMARFGPGTHDDPDQDWSELDCNLNLIALLRWSEAQALPNALMQRISDRPRKGPR